MSKNYSEHLFKKYLNASTSLEEEEKLFNKENQQPEVEAWSKFVALNKTKIPENLEPSIWKTIEKKKKRQQHMIYYWSGIAASIIFLVAVTFNYKSTEMNYEEKAALLNEALAMFPEDNHKIDNQDIIFEDDTIIIYMATN